MRPIRLGGGSKYHSRRVTLPTGERFDSEREAARWLVLREREQRGEIHALRRQVRYPLHAAGGTVVGHYVADFVYVDDGERVIEDAKGVVTQLYAWKRRHVLAEYGVRIYET